MVKRRWLYDFAFYRTGTRFSQIAFNSVAPGLERQNLLNPAHSPGWLALFIRVLAATGASGAVATCSGGLGGPGRAGGVFGSAVGGAVGSVARAGGGDMGSPVAGDGAAGVVCGGATGAPFGFAASLVGAASASDAGAELFSSFPFGWSTERSSWICLAESKPE